jgi:2-iminobutanoate/2-iminopropanoate deaminase
MNQPISPATIAAPAANYSHAILTEQPQQWLHTAGVVPVARDGTVPEDLRAQAAQVWSNISAMLHDAGMTVNDVVSVTTYVVAGHDLGVVMAARDEAMAGHKPASTLVVVPALARAEWKMEVAVVAAS